MAERLIPLTAEWSEFVERQVNETGYASSADVVEVALAELAAREAEAEVTGRGHADAEREEIRQNVWLGIAPIERGEGTSYEFTVAGRVAFLESARTGGLAEGERRRAAEEKG
jgi:Arc/MetJ-type ribon-helix-helix transcriptional regulator